MSTFTDSNFDNDEHLTTTNSKVTADCRQCQIECSIVDGPIGIAFLHGVVGERSNVKTSLALAAKRSFSTLPVTLTTT